MKNLYVHNGSIELKISILTDTRKKNFQALIERSMHDQRFNASFFIVISITYAFTYINNREAKEICMTNRVIDYTNLENNIIIILSNGLTCSKKMYLYLISHHNPSLENIILLHKK